MRTRIKINKNSRRLRLNLNPKNQLLILIILTLAGVVAGSIIAKNGAAGKSSLLSFFSQGAFTQAAVAKGLFSLITASFLSTALIIVLSFFSGLCAAGMPVLIFLPVIKGIGVGIAFGGFYIQFGCKGIIIAALCLLPQAVIASLAVILSCRDSFRFSVRLVSAVLPVGEQPQLRAGFPEFCFKQLIYLFIALAASILQAFSYTALAGILFN